MKVRSTLIILSFLLLKTSLVFSQQTVKGTIISKESNEPLIGVSILEKSTSNGTITDFDGNFEIETSGPEAILVISYTGYESQEISIGTNTQIQVLLAINSTLLDEVVVIAYGETAKRKFTGSLTSVSSKDIESIPQASAVQMLQGRAPGVYVNDGGGAPGTTGQIVIRGVGTLNGSSAPLYVIDGTPTDGLTNLNPNDIESISILKDASATSIYGSRAANGVVLITTKKGDIGKTKFKLSAQYGVSEFENRNNFRLLTADEYTSFYRGLAIDAGIDPDDNASGFYLPTNNLTNTDWVDAVTQTGTTQQYEFSASGGSEKSTHFLSASYFNQEGNIIGTDFERFTGRLNFSLSPIDKVSVDFRVLGSYQRESLKNRNGGRADQWSGAHSLSPLASIFADENTVLNGLGYNFDLPSNAGHNAVAASDINSNNANSIRIFPTLRLSYQPIDGLTLATSASIDWTFSRRDFFQSKFYLAETENGVSVLDQSTAYDRNFNATATYNFAIGEAHDFTALFGYELYQQSNTFTSASSQDFAFEDISNFAAGGQSNSDFLDFGFDSEALSAFFGRLNYAFNNQLFVNASLRRDGSSKFGPDNRYGTFYAFGGGYNIIEQANNSKKINNLRVRASYGISGNDRGAGPFSWRATYSAGGTFVVPGGTNVGSRPSGPGNNRLKWEQSENINLGIDFGLLSNRIIGSIDIYQRGSIDLVTDRLISRTGGFNSIIDNIGEVQNRGIELALSTINLQLNGFEWRSDFNITFNQNEIISLNGVSDTLAEATTARIVGQPLGQWYLPQFAGVDPATGAALYETAEGGLTTDIANALVTVSGNTNNNPDYYGSFTNSFSYKGFSLSAMLYFRYGTKVYREFEQDLNTPGGNNLSATVLNAWKKPGDITNVPKASLLETDLNNSTRFLEDASYIRLRNVAVSYQLPEKLTNQWGLSNFQLSVRAINLFTWTEYNGYNPDTGSTEEDSDYPVNRTITFGLSTNF